MPPPVTDWKQEEFLCVRHNIPGGSTSSCGRFKEANNGPTVCPQVTKRGEVYHPGVSGCLVFASTLVPSPRSGPHRDREHRDRGHRSFCWPITPLPFMSSTEVM